MELAQTFEECDSVNQLQQLQYGGQQVKHTDTERSPLQPAHTPPPPPGGHVLTQGGLRVMREASGDHAALLSKPM